MPRLLLALVATLLLLPAAAAQTPTDPAPAPEEVPPPPPSEPEPEREPEPRIIYVERPAAERPAHRPPPVRAVNIGPRRLSGPRIGLTYLPPRIVEEINDFVGEEILTTPIISQFGWQLERPLYQSGAGTTAVVETIMLVGGLERGLALPSGSFIVGVRSPAGLEVGLGPNISATGVAYALAVGVANDFGDVNIPMNMAFVFGRDGLRASLLVGFTFSDRRY